MRKTIFIATILTVLLWNTQSTAAPVIELDYTAPAIAAESIQMEHETEFEMVYTQRVSRSGTRRGYILTINKVRETAKVDDGQSGDQIATALENAYYEFGLDKRDMNLGMWIAQAKVESNFNSKIRGSSGEYGLMQIMPFMGKWLNDKYFKIDNFTYDMLMDPTTNTRFAAKLVQLLLDEHQDVSIALECYNKGPTGVNYNDYSGRVQQAYIKLFK